MAFKHNRRIVYSNRKSMILKHERIKNSKEKKKAEEECQDKNWHQREQNC
jgi:hypothetical protein